MEIETVFVRAPAFAQMLGYAIEVYKRECTGVLMGDIFGSAGKVVVNSVVALQSSERRYTSVEPNFRRYARIEEVLAFLSWDFIVGEFHSHTDFGGIPPTCRLSEDDREYIRENREDGEVEIVVALRKKKRARGWRYVRADSILRGTLGEYDVEIGAYFKASEDDDGTLAEIWVPITQIANIAAEEHLSPQRGYIFGEIPEQFPLPRYRKLVRLIRMYEDKLIRTQDPDEGEELLDEITLLMREIVSISRIYE